MATYRTTIEIDGFEDVPVTVDYDFDPPCRGSFEPGGLQIEPDDPGGIYINSVDIDDQNSALPKSDLTKEMVRSLQEEIGEYLYEASQPDPDRYRE